MKGSRLGGQWPANKGEESGPRWSADYDPPGLQRRPADTFSRHLNPPTCPFRCVYSMITNYRTNLVQSYSIIATTGPTIAAVAAVAVGLSPLWLMNRNREVRIRDGKSKVKKLGNNREGGTTERRV